MVYRVLIKMKRDCDNEAKELLFTCVCKVGGGLQRDNTVLAEGGGQEVYY